MGESRRFVGRPYKVRDSNGPSRSVCWRSKNVRLLQYIRIGGAIAPGMYHLNAGRERHEAAQADFPMSCNPGSRYARSSRRKLGFVMILHGFLVTEAAKSFSL